VLLKFPIRLLVAIVARSSAAVVEHLLNPLMNWGWVDASRFEGAGGFQVQ